MPGKVSARGVVNSTCDAVTRYTDNTKLGSGQKDHTQTVDK